MVALTRQDIYLADMPLALIGNPRGKSLSNQELAAHISLGLDLQIIVKSAFKSLAFSPGSADSPVGRYGYQHGPSQTTNQSSNKTAKESPNPTLLIEQAANLIAVSLPSSSSSSSVTKSYHYEDARFPQALTGISIQGQGSDAQMISQRLSTYLYNPRGQAVLSVKGEPARLEADKQSKPLDPKRLVPGTGIEQVHVHIIQPALHNKAGSTLVTNSEGQQTLYRHQIIGGEHRLLEARGAGCASCGPVNISYRYDSLGRQTGQTSLVPTAIKDGQPTSPAQALQTTRTAYTAQGAPMDVTPTAPQVQYNDSRWPDKPTLLVRPSVIKGQATQIQLSYNDYGQVTQISQTGFSPIDVKGQIANSADQASKIERTTKYTYRLINNKSVLTQIDGPLPNGPKASPEDSDITTLQYDQRADYLTATTQPGGFKSTVTYDSAGRIASVKNAEGSSTQWTYCANWLASITSTGPGWDKPRVQSFKYDALGRVVETGTGGLSQGDQTTNYRAQTVQGFDAAGRPVWAASALGIAQQNSYDTESRLLQTSRASNAMAQTSSNRFDALGRLEATWSHTGQGYALAYNALGDVQSITDERGRVTALSAGIARSIKPASANKSTRPASQDLSDDFGRLVARMSPDSGITTYQHDAADRLIASTDAQGNTAQYSFDAAGRITRQVITASAAQLNNKPNQPEQQNQPLITEWIYQGKQLTTVKFPTQTEHYSYDARGFKIAKMVVLKSAPTAPNQPGQASAGPATAVTRYRYDEAGVLQSTSLPDGSQLVYERNGQGQVVALKRSQLQTPWLQRWASWMLPAQTIVQDLQRDIVGLKSYTTGNGIEASYQRSQNATLARVMYRSTKPDSSKLQTAANNKPVLLMGATTQDTISALLGVGNAYAADAPKPIEQTTKETLPGEAGKSTLPGALGLPADPQALIDHRYLWDTAGNLLLTQGKANTAAYAYDSQDRLIIASQDNGQAMKQVSTSGTNSGQTTSRYHYAQGKRVLAQEGITDSADLQTNTIKAAYQPGSHRWLGSQANDQTNTTRYNANGQPDKAGNRNYSWDALGRLTNITQENKPLASYTYNHRGERISKTSQGKTTSYLYEDGQLSAELNEAGNIIRQYIYLADMPIAVIDTPQGKSLQNQELLAHVLLGLDLQIIVKSAWSALTNSDTAAETTNWLHTNHLGAPEAATDKTGQLIWQANYAPFGSIIKASLKTKEAFTLNLRLPGQYEDQETGLHYNKQRYYDPSRGEYLSPDPLGTPDGPNGYAYVRYNPLKYIDPEGLILFAFDGTGNTEATRTNVFWMREAYQDNDTTLDANNKPLAFSNRPFYIEGPGTGQLGDGALAFSLRGRINTQLGRLDTYVKDKWVNEIDVQKKTYSQEAPLIITLDIIGFSRGAAAARDFANQVIERKNRNYYNKDLFGFTGTDTRYNCVGIKLRFMGLFDTVLSTATGSFNTGISSSQIEYVAQAVAVNEHRALFPLLSIDDSSGGAGFTAGRVEKGFIGAHSDIGGGYTGRDGGDLSDVALNWMVQQAGLAGVTLEALKPDQLKVTNPILHDESRVAPWVLPGFGGLSSDRTMTYLDGSASTTKQAATEGMTYNLSLQGQAANSTESKYIDYDKFFAGNKVGKVNMTNYKEWLSSQGVTIQ